MNGAFNSINVHMITTLMFLCLLDDSNLRKCAKTLKIWRARKDSNSQPPGSKPVVLLANFPYNHADYCTLGFPNKSEIQGDKLQ
jgi:hypothetical protein